MARHNSSEASERIRREILRSMTQIDDPGYRAILSILMRVMDNVERHTDSIFEALDDKLDKVLDDTDRVRGIVKDTMPDKHEEHHTWLSKHDTKSNYLIYAVDLLKDREKHGGYCDYAHRKMEDEKENMKSKRNMAETLIVSFIKVIGLLIFGSFLPGIFDALSK